MKDFHKRELHFRHLSKATYMAIRSSTLAMKVRKQSHFQPKPTAGLVSDWELWVDLGRQIKYPDQTFHQPSWSQTWCCLSLWWVNTAWDHWSYQEESHEVHHGGSRKGFQMVMAQKEWGAGLCCWHTNQDLTNHWSPKCGYMMLKDLMMCRQ